MQRELIHIYGSLSICSFGLFIALGLFVFVKLVERDPLYRCLRLQDKFMRILLVGILALLVGGRLLSIYTYPESFDSVWQMLSPWEAGYSILGAVLAALIILPWYLRRLAVPILPFLDLVGLYAPVLQSISRVGCFFAGCCFGATTSLPWGVIYGDPNSSAPQGVSLHPSQLYSSIGLFGIFLILYFVLRHRLRKPGQLAASYLILISIERFMVDFFRGDRVMIWDGILSVDQAVALLVYVLAVNFFILVTFGRTEDVGSGEHI